MTVMLVTRRSIVEYDSLQAGRLALWMDPDSSALVVYGHLFGWQCYAIRSLKGGAA
jgi:hypothetical protein